MSKLILTLLVLLIAACSSQPKSVSIGDGSSASSTIKVIGKGRTFDEAKANGFSSAVEIALGSIVLADRELSSNHLIRDDIAKHSSGYVENYFVISRTDTDSAVSLLMDVTVKSSKIQDRVLSQRSEYEKVEGDKLIDQYKTYLKDRSSGDKLLDMVLADYSRHAFNVKKGKSSFKLDQYRNAIFIIEYELSWNYNYLKALNEVLAILSDNCERNLQQEKIIIMSKDPKAWILGKTERHCFNDQYRARRIKQAFLGTTTVYAEIKDLDGKVIFSGCSSPIHLVGSVMHDPMVIYGNEKIENEVLIKIPPNSTENIKLDKATKVEISYTNGGCYSVNQN